MAGTSLLEKVVPNGAEVCVVGLYSAATAAFGAASAAVLWLAFFKG